MGKNELSETPLIPLGPALVGNPLCLGQEEHTMCETEVKSEIPDSGPTCIRINEA